ncbi:MAG: putative porin [Paucibacter sp.]|nr:putative porin [Roseateles sp.]
MKYQAPKRPLLVPSAVMAAVLTLAPLAAHADEHEDLEKLRATVLALIDTLVKSGLLPRNQADAMMKDAQRRATEQLAQAPAPEVGADGKKIVRVPYIPEAVKVQMREQIKAEVLAETRAQQTVASADSGIGTRFNIMGDFRLRTENLRPNSSNTAALAYSTNNPDFTRAPDLWANPNANTQAAEKRTRIRLRIDSDFIVNNQVTVGAGISTLASTPNSQNQTMATGPGGAPNYFNGYAVGFDKAFLTYKPFEALAFTGGRFNNPFLATDLVWDESVNFEGAVIKAKGPTPSTSNIFMTAGWFPLAFTSVSSNLYTHRDLYAAQVGADWTYGLKDNHLKVGAAVYDYNNVEGIMQFTTLPSGTADYLASEYGSGYRQRGNTLFRINTSPLYDSATNWGLASSFKELDFTAVADVAEFDPVHVRLTGDFVYNLGFDRKRIATRTGAHVIDGSPYGYLLSLQVGAAKIKEQGDWNAAISYRRLGSDAVIDAFPNGDFGGGGTNVKGFMLTGNLGIARNTWLTMRLLSSQNIDSAVPNVGQGSTATKFDLDTLQLDLNARF